MKVKFVQLTISCSHYCATKEKSTNVPENFRALNWGPINWLLEDDVKSILNPKTNTILGPNKACNKRNRIGSHHPVTRAVREISI